METYIRKKRYEKFRRKCGIRLSGVRSLRNQTCLRFEGGHFQQLLQHAVNRTQ